MSWAPVMAEAVRLGDYSASRQMAPLTSVCGLTPLQQACLRALVWMEWEMCRAQERFNFVGGGAVVGYNDAVTAISQIMSGRQGEQADVAGIARQVIEVVINGNRLKVGRAWQMIMNGFPSKMVDSIERVSSAVNPYFLSGNVEHVRGLTVLCYIEARCHDMWDTYFAGKNAPSWGHDLLQLLNTVRTHMVAGGTSSLMVTYGLFNQLQNIIDKLGALNVKASLWKRIAAWFAGWKYSWLFRRHKYIDVPKTPNNPGQDLDEMRDFAAAVTGMPASTASQSFTSQSQLGVTTAQLFGVDLASGQSTTAGAFVSLNVNGEAVPTVGIGLPSGFVVQPSGTVSGNANISPPMMGIPTPGVTSEITQEAIAEMERLARTPNQDAIQESSIRGRSDAQAEEDRHIFAAINTASGNPATPIEQIKIELSHTRQKLKAAEMLLTGEVSKLRLEASDLIVLSTKPGQQLVTSNDQAQALRDVLLQAGIAGVRDIQLVVLPPGNKLEALSRENLEKLGLYRFNDDDIRATMKKAPGKPPKVTDNQPYV